MTDHTSGDWWILDNGSEEELSIVARRDEPFRDVAYLKRELDQDFAEVEANAHLITAAPELLEACEAMQTQMAALLMFHDQYNLSPMVRATFEQCLTMADKAIVKAQAASYR